MGSPDAALAVERVMIGFERRAFLEAFTRMNPHWQGAKVADVLSELDNADSCLALVEGMYDAHASDVEDSALLSAATRAVALTYALFTVEEAWPHVEELVNAVEAGWENPEGSDG